MVQKGELWEYRAGWKQGVYESFSRETATLTAVTLTTRYEMASPESFNRRIRRALGDAFCDGLVLIEEGRGDGRLHAHGILVDAVSAAEVTGEWSNSMGFVVAKPLTDLMGWITYMFKAFGPESSWTWRKDGKYANTGKGGTGVRVPARGTSEAEAAQQASFEEVEHQTPEGT